MTLLVMKKSLTLPVLLFFFSLNLLTASGDERQQFNTLEKRSFELSEEMRSLIVDIYNKARSSVVLRASDMQRLPVNDIRLLVEPTLEHQTAAAVVVKRPVGSGTDEKKDKLLLERMITRKKRAIISPVDFNNNIFKRLEENFHRTKQIIGREIVRGTGVVSRNRDALINSLLERKKIFQEVADYYSGDELAEELCEGEIGKIENLIEEITKAT